MYASGVTHSMFRMYDQSCPNFPNGRNRVYEERKTGIEGKEKHYLIRIASRCTATHHITSHHITSPRVEIASQSQCDRIAAYDVPSMSSCVCPTGRRVMKMRLVSLLATRSSEMK
jgi:hypothetical protein